MKGKSVVEKMLAAIEGCSGEISRAISKEHPSIRSLYRGWSVSGEKMLEDIAVGKRRVGTALATAIFKAFNSTNPNETI